MRVNVMIVLILVYCALAFPTWEAIGPYGGRLYEIAKALNDDNVVYAGISENPARLFKSTNGGDSWFTITGTPLLWAMAADPTDHNTVYVGGVTEIFKSTDGGSNWTTYAVANSFSGMEDFAFDPNTSSTIYSVASIYLGDTLEVPGFFKSTNAGISWSSLVLTDTLGKAYCVAVDPSNPNTIYAGATIYHFAYMPRVFKSTDGGATFTTISTGLTGGSYAYALAVHPTSSNIVYAGTYLGGIYRSSNGGGSWNLVSSDTLRIYRFSTTPIDPNHVYAGAQMAVMKSTNSGQTWFNSGTGIRGKNARGLIASHLQSNRVYAGNLSGFFKTSNGGADWLALNNGINGLPMMTFEVAPSSPTTIYAYGYAIGVYKTTDGGGSWTILPEFTADASVDDLAVDYSNPDIVLSVEGSGPGYAELFKSNDGGANWFVDDGGYHDSGGAVTTHPLSGLVYWYGGGSSLSDPPNVKSVSRTTDGGSTWTRHDCTASSGRTHSLEVDPSNPAVLYAGGNPPVHKSTDGGTSWIDLSSGIVGYVYDVAIDTTNPNIVYAVTPAGVYKSTNGGTGWTDTGTMNGCAVAINPYDHDVVYAGTGTGVYVSTSGGGGWTPMNDGLDNTDVTCLGITQDYLYASTDGAGIFKWDISVGVAENRKKTAAGSRLLVRSNPTRRPVHIVYQLQNGGEARLSVYDVCGTLIRTVVNETVSAHTCVTVWDGRDSRGKEMPAGIYFIELVSRDVRLRQKLALFK